MAQHCFWANERRLARAKVKQHRPAAAARPGARFDKLRRALQAAAQEGLDAPAVKDNLEELLYETKQLGMPAEAIAHAIETPPGPFEGAPIKASTYEWKGPDGVLIMVEALPSNTTRTTMELTGICGRHQFERLADGTTKSHFERMGFIAVDAAGADEHALADLVFHAGGGDLRKAGEVFEITTSSQAFLKVFEALSGAGCSIRKAARPLVPREEIYIRPRRGEAKSVVRVLAELEEHPDVLRVFHNAKIPDFQVYAPILSGIRVVGGLLCLLLGLVLLLNFVAVPLLLPKTTEAWGNAPRILVRTEVEGNVQTLVQTGDPVRKDQVIARHFNTHLDQNRASSLKTQEATLEAERERLQAEYEVVEGLLQKSIEELEKYRQALIAMLEASLRESDARSEELSVIYAQSKRVLEIHSGLTGKGVLAVGEHDAAVEAEAAAGSRLEQAQAARDRLVIELKSARDNIFLQRDSPIYLTWSLQLEQAVPQLGARIVEHKKRLEAIKVEVGGLRKFDTRLAGGEIRSPSDGVVWHRSSSSGPLGKGEQLLEIAETEGSFVEARFSEFDSKSLVPGAKVAILFTGRAALTGTVHAVRQPSPADHDSAYVIRLPRLNQVTVHLRLDQPLDSTLIGRRCRVLGVNPGTRPAPGSLFQWLAVKSFLAWGF